MPRDHLPGFRFKEGKLDLFTEESVILLESWPALKALRKERGIPWTEFTPWPSIPACGLRARRSSSLKWPGFSRTVAKRLVQSWLELHALSAGCTQ